MIALNAVSFQAMLVLLMADDNPSVLTERQRDEMVSFVDGVAKEQGFAGWVEAYHALSAPAAPFNFEAHLQRQAEWSAATFGPGLRTKGLIEHIASELVEIHEDPTDLREWIDVVILGLDGAWRTGATPAQIIAALVAKQTKNEGRTWPDWHEIGDRAIMHIKDPA